MDVQLQDLGRLVGMARAAYQAYGDEAGWKNFAGQPMPRWEELGPRVQDCWMAATARVRAEVMRALSEASG